MKIDEAIAAGADITALPITNFTPTLAPEALHGLAGRITRLIEPYSEADPAAILAHVLIAAGNVVGRGPHALVEQTIHPCNEFAVLTGLTSKGRKGQAWSSSRWLFAQVDEGWTNARIRTGLSSGEGVIYQVRDAHEEEEPIKEKGRVVDYQRVVVDPGEPDKRLFIIEPELASVLKRIIMLPRVDRGRCRLPRTSWRGGSSESRFTVAPIEAAVIAAAIATAIREAGP